MRAPLRVPVSGLVPGGMSLDDDARRYVARVHRRGVGDALVLFDPELGQEAEAVIVELGRGAIRVDVSAPRPGANTPMREITLVQALGKSAASDEVVRDATALGVTALVFAATERALSQGAPRERGRAERWRRISVQAARQCQRGDLPRIDGPVSLSEVLARYGVEADSVLAQATLRLQLQVGAQRGFASALREAPARPLALLVGPEGGLSPAEQDAAASAGFEPVNLGSYVLRTELAAAVALGVVAALGAGH